MYKAGDYSSMKFIYDDRNRTREHRKCTEAAQHEHSINFECKYEIMQVLHYKN